MFFSFQRGIALLFLSVFATSSLIAQERKIEFDDGTTMTFEMLKQDPTKPIPLYIGIDFAGYYLPSVGINATYGLQGFYFINPDISIVGKAGFGLSTLGILPEVFEVENDFYFTNMELGGYYSFAKSVKEKKAKLNLKSVSTGYKQRTNYVMDIKEPRQRSWEAYLGLGSFNLPGGRNYNNDDLQAQGIEGISSLSIVGQSITTLEVGISTRSFTRNVFLLDGRVKGQSYYNRWTAKLMLPVVSSVMVEEEVDDFIYEVKEDVDYFDNQRSTLGFGIFYQTINNSATTFLNLLSGYSLGLAMYPFVESTPFLSFGFTLGFGLNDPKQLID